MFFFSLPVVYHLATTVLTIETGTEKERRRIGDIIYNYNKDVYIYA